MTINWGTAAAISVTVSTLMGFAFWISTWIYFPLSGGDTNTRNVQVLEEKLGDVRVEKVRVWNAVNMMRNAVAEVKTNQRLIQKDVENILVILRGRVPPRAYRNPREE